MRQNRAGMTISLAGLVVFSTLGLAQHHDPSQEKSGDTAKGPSMMKGGMMSQHQEMSQLMTKVMESMAAINSEKDPEKLKALHAEHSALLEQMRGRMMGQAKMMQDMEAKMKSCPMMNSMTNPAGKRDSK